MVLFVVSWMSVFSLVVVLPLLLCRKVFPFGNAFSYSIEIVWEDSSRSIFVFPVSSNDVGISACSLLQILKLEYGDFFSQEDFKRKSNKTRKIRKNF